MIPEPNGSLSDPLWSKDLEAAHGLAQIVGILMGLGTPVLFSGLLFTRVLPPGDRIPAELVQQVGYLFTGLVFFASAWLYWRSGRTLAGFRKVKPHQRPGMLLRESVLYAALSELSCILGLIYWVLAGEVAGRHAWGFILLTPLLFLGIVPRKTRWKQALKG